MFSELETVLYQFKRFLENEDQNEFEKQGLVKSFEYTF